MNFLLWIFFGIVVAGTIFFVLRNLISERRSRRNFEKFLSEPFPKSWEKIISQSVPAASKIPKNLRSRYEILIKEFLAEKNFVACGGLKNVSDKIAVVVAATASILALGRSRKSWRDLKSVLIYPSAFRSRGDFSESDNDFGGGDLGNENFCDGESWSDGSVIFSQERILRDLAFPGNPRNVLIHEFAHQFADTEGISLSAELGKKWREILFSEMQRLKSGDAGTILDEYGSDDPAEFFAVASEAFFETPETLKKNHENLYEILTKIYALNPAAWASFPEK